MRLFRVLCSTDGTGTGTGTEPPPPAVTPPPPAAPPAAPAAANPIAGLGSNPGDSVESFRVALAKHNNDVGQLAALLFSENHTLRERIRDLRQKVPKDGSVVLSAEDGQSWAAYQSLGKPDDLRRTVAEHTSLGSEISALRRSEELRTVADLTGYKLPVLKQLAANLTFDIQTSEDPRTKAVTRSVSVKDADDKLTAIDEYAKAHWGDFLSSLLPQVEPPARPRGTPTREGVPAARSQGEQPAAAPARSIPNLVR
jgi:hypothetical protein